jgi:hypothetical protein
MLAEYNSDQVMAASNWRDYAGAFRMAWPHAEAGHPDAQSVVGTS